jgi:hypothetical protein
MLQDTDTVAILQAVEREQADPLVWFRGDWPLKNHFYRPVSTLSFWLDLEVGGRDAAVFGTTNAVLAVLCVLLLYWFLRETTDAPWLAGAGTAVFVLWHVGEAYLRYFETGLAWLWTLCLFGMLRGGKEKLVPCILALLGCLFFSSQVGPVDEFSSRIIDWLPGRTASVMTVFALASTACYARFVRTTATAQVAEATSEDVPATKSTTVAKRPFAPALLVVFSSIALVLALGSYEQAVMVPALLLGVWLLAVLQRRMSAWWPHIVFWLLLVGYLVLRSRLVPAEASGYQEQQFRSGVGVWIGLGHYLLPSVYELYATLTSLSAGLLLVLEPSFWSSLLTSVSNWTSFWVAGVSQRWRWPFFGFLLMSFVAYLPMAWLKPFGHYHYLPSAFRAAFVVVLAAVVFRLVVSAVSLPELRAPARRGPAPGSLLRP